TSWGLSTRTIGVMVMVHGDDKGLVMPPRVAETQVIIIPCGLTADTGADLRAKITDACLGVEARLKHAGVRADTDLRDGYTAGFKFNHWEMRGVPVRLEIGPKDLQKGSVLSVRRDNGEKASLAMESLESSLKLLLINIQDQMLARARATMDSRIKTVLKWDDFVPALSSKCLVLIPWCERSVCEDQIKERSTRDVSGDEPEDEKAPSMGAKSLCLPFKQPTENPIVPGVTKCVQCGQDAKRYASTAAGIPDGKLQYVWESLMEGLLLRHVSKDQIMMQKGNMLGELHRGRTDTLCYLATASHRVLANHNKYREFEYANLAVLAIYYAAKHGVLTHISQSEVSSADCVLVRELSAGQGRSDWVTLLHSSKNRRNEFGMIVEFKFIPNEKTGDPDFGKAKAEEGVNQISKTKYASMLGLRELPAVFSQCHE
ncbi:hypothetical protein GGI11_005785, partial [Coemansia sp. RSA 2049]